jgi:hypothetical protein
MGGKIMSGFETFEVPTFLLQGGILPTARLARATRGTLSAPGQRGAGAELVYRDAR